MRDVFAVLMTSFRPATRSPGRTAAAAALLSLTAACSGTTDPQPTVVDTRPELFFVSGRDPDHPARLTSAGRDFHAVTPFGPPVVVLQAAWAPDGQQFAYRGVGVDGQSTRLFLGRADASASIPIGPDGAFSPTWSPDGRRIAFRSGDGRVSTMAPDGSAVAVVPNTVNAEGSPPSWSPDGAVLAVGIRGTTAASSQTTTIYLVPLDGSARRVLVPPDDSAGGTGDSAPSWSPDGRQIAFSRCRGTGECVIAVVNTDGSNLRALTSNNIDARPSWSPDGRWIAFERDVSGTAGYEVFVLPASGGTPQNVSQAAGNDLNPCWRTARTP